MDNNIAVLVISCDYYEEAWQPFFSLFKKYWENCPYAVYLCTEHISNVKLPENVGIIKTGDGAWSKRLNIALKSIHASRIILLLEDFFFQRPVNEEKLQDVIAWMERDPQIAVIYFNKITGYEQKSLQYEGYYEMKPINSCRYMCNCQAALWKKEVLIAATENSLSPQQFEDYGFTYLSEQYKAMIFLCSINSRYDALRDGDVFSYILDRDKGYGIWASKWLWNNKKFFKREGIVFENKRLKIMTHRDFLFMKAREKTISRFRFLKKGSGKKNQRVSSN